MYKRQPIHQIRVLRDASSLRTLLTVADSVLVIPTDGTSKCSITFRSGGYVYDSCLTEKLIEMSGVEVPEGKSRKIGIFTTNQLEDGSIYAEVKFN